MGKGDQSILPGDAYSIRIPKGSSWELIWDRKIYRFSLEVGKASVHLSSPSGD